MVRGEILLHRSASRDQLDGDSWRIYDYVVRHFIGTVSYNCKYQSTTVNFSIGEEKFSFSGKKLIEPGFTAVMTWQALTSEESMPNLQKGDTLPIKEVCLCLRQRIDFWMELTVKPSCRQNCLSDRRVLQITSRSRISSR